MCTSILLFSCGGSDTKDESKARNWTGYVKCIERGGVTHINAPRFPTTITVNDDMSFSLVYYYNGKEAMTINGTATGTDDSLNASVYTDLEYDESSTAKATFAFNTTIGADGIATGSYSIKYDDPAIGAASDESGDICVTTGTVGIAGTWYGGYQATDGSYDGWVKVTFNDDGSFTASHYESDSNDSDFSFTGTYSLTGTEFSANSTGKFNETIEDHTGSYPASLKGSILINGTYTVNTVGSYTGLWALAKELK